MHFFYPPSLPISGSLGQLRDAVTNHQVVVVAGETGSGKTTQLPKLCLELFHQGAGMIGCTQPRRIAATSVAARVAEELGEFHGVVGSKIRFHDRTTEETRIKFMTDGVLLAETRNDPQLRNYQVIIVDEAHERNLNIDFLLGYLYKLIRKRDDLKLIITSATIDTQAFSAHFGNAPVVAIEGRTYPVEIAYAPPPDDEAEGSSYLEHCLETIAETCTTRSPGDMLVFLPTEKDIRSCCEVLRGRMPSHCILPLFGRLQARDQQQIFKPQKKPKIVVATNVAETSVTVPGIRYVIDSGLARIGSYTPRSRTMRLPIERVSQASCNQRSGRSGRVGPGLCIRLFSEDDFNERKEFTVPEIQRSNLAEVILQMVSFNLGDPHDFPFLDPPRRSAITEGYRTLRELGAINAKKRLTAHGKIMSQLPIDPVISRIIIEARAYDCLSEIIIIAAALAIQDPRIRPAEKEQLADAAHRQFSDPRSDFVALLNIWNGYHRDHPTFSWSGLKKFCQRNYLSFQRMREWLDLEEQLRRLIGRRKKFRFNSEPASYEAIHRALLAGLFRQCARRKKGNLYQGLGNRELRIFPGSYQSGRSGEWIIGGSFIETSQLFILSAATIEPEWLEQSCAPFCSYSWSSVRYQKKTGRVVADETVALQGLVIVTGRLVDFPSRDKKNVAPAREVFIRSALVDDQLTGRFTFQARNQALLKKWQQREDRLRRRDILIDEDTIYDFYDRRLPDEVCDRPSLIGHIGQHGDDTLHMSEDDILLRIPGEKDLLDYPATLPMTGGAIKLDYNFEPGASNDGVTALIPEQIIETIDPDLFDWLVPGMIVEKTTHLLKGLPKRIRKQLIPINDTVALLLDSIDMYRGNYLQQLSREIQKRYRLNIRREDWPRDQPSHLSMHYRIVDSSGKTLMNSNDFRSLLKRTRSAPSSGPAEPQPADQLLIRDLESRYFSTWDFSGCPERIPVQLPGGRVGGYLFRAIRPVTERQAVAVRYLASREEALRVSSAGLTYLVRLQFKPQFKELAKQVKLSLSGPSGAWLCSSLGSSVQAREKILDFIIKAAGEDSSVRSGGADDDALYDSLIAVITSKNLYTLGHQIVDTVMTLVRQRREVAELIFKFENLARKSSSYDGALFDDLKHQLEMLVPADFLDTFSTADVKDCSRYLKSLAIRSERGYNNPHKDLEKRKMIAPHQENLERARKNLPELTAECREKFSDCWAMLAELRVSLFSPEIKTARPVSPKKMTQAWKDFAAGC